MRHNREKAQLNEDMNQEIKKLNELWNSKMT